MTILHMQIPGLWLYSEGKNLVIFLKMKNCFSVLFIILVVGFAMQVAPHFFREGDIAWQAVLTRYGISIVLTILFWLFLFGGIGFLTSNGLKNEGKDRD